MKYGIYFAYWERSWDVDKAGDWERSVKNVRTVARIANDLGIDYCLVKHCRRRYAVLCNSYLYISYKDNALITCSTKADAYRITKICFRVFNFSDH